MPGIGKFAGDELTGAVAWLLVLEVNTSDPCNKYPIASPATRQTTPSVYAWVVVHSPDCDCGCGRVLCELPILCFYSYTVVVSAAC